MPHRTSKSSDGSSDRRRVTPPPQPMMDALSASQSAVLNMQRSIGNQAVQRLLNGTIQRALPYADIPDKATWKTDSSMTGKPRSDALKAIDEWLLQWETTRTGDDKKAQVDMLFSLRQSINNWQNEKQRKYVPQRPAHQRADLQRRHRQLPAD